MADDLTVYDLAGFADTLRRNRDGHRALYDANGKEADRAYTEGFSRALHELYLCTFGDHGEPLPQYREHPRERSDSHPDTDV